jgi:hypothetical protein
MSTPEQARSSSDALEQLEAEARYHRERLQLYRARIYSGRPTTAAGQRERERMCKYAERRLRQAQLRRAGPL